MRPRSPVRLRLRPFAAPGPSCGPPLLLPRLALVKACRKRFRRGLRAETPRERSQRVWRRARSLARKCRSHCRRDVRDSLHNPSQADRNLWRETRSACRPQPKARHAAPARSRPPGTRQLFAPRNDSFSRIRCLHIVECEIPAFLIAEFGHSPEEICIMWGVSRLHTDKADTQHLWLLLRPCRERQRRRAAEQRDELAPLHSITSSARNRNDSGIVRSMALAALRLMIRVNRVGTSTGRSAGLAPFRILSTKVANRR